MNGEKEGGCSPPFCYIFQKFSPATNRFIALNGVVNLTLHSYYGMQEQIIRRYERFRSDTVMMNFRFVIDEVTLPGEILHKNDNEMCQKNKKAAHEFNF